tara:strand:- start:19 stop:567 length:549 start_codon:yes stop_codon:yes gene_type:complete
MESKYTYWYWDKFFNTKDLKEIKKICDNNLVKSVDRPANTTKTSIVKFCEWRSVKDKLNTLNELIKVINVQKFGYTLYDLNDYDYININSYFYQNQGEYDWHSDGSKSHIFDIKFTVIINTSLNKYEGGKFYLFDNGPKHIEILDNPGSVLMFKSYINHKVDPVVKGTRDSIAIFVKGPRFI